MSLLQEFHRDTLDKLPVHAAVPLIDLVGKFLQFGAFGETTRPIGDCISSKNPIRLVADFPLIIKLWFYCRIFVVFQDDSIDWSPSGQLQSTHIPLFTCHLLGVINDYVWKR